LLRNAKARAEGFAGLSTADGSNPNNVNAGDVGVRAVLKAGTFVGFGSPAGVCAVAGYAWAPRTIEVNRMAEVEDWRSITSPLS
jgi:hypothetical protein